MREPIRSGNSSPNVFISALRNGSSRRNVGVLPLAIMLCSIPAVAVPVGYTAAIVPQTEDRLVEVVDLQIARQGHTATLMGNGNVLVVGGVNESGAVMETEIYDPVSHSFHLGIGALAARTDHTAVLLADGRILIAGVVHLALPSVLEKSPLVIICSPIPGLPPGGMKQ